MKCKMLFRIGMTIVILVAILLFYLNNRQATHSKEKILERVRSEHQAFEDSLAHHKAQNPAPDPDNDDTGREGHDLKNEINADQKGDENESLKVEDGQGAAYDAHKQRHGEKEYERSQNREDPVVQWDTSVVGHDDPGLKPRHHRTGKQVNTQVHIIHLAVVACGDRAEETIILLKSAVVMTTSTPLVFHIFAERELHDYLTQQLDFWPEEILDRVDYRVYDITYPASENAEMWKKLFKPCATQRLFIPSLLTSVDSLLYVDTDILFVSPLHKIWTFFSHFNSSQLVGLAPESQDANTGWYNRFARHPYVPPLGVNSGVMLMNLTRLRQSTWLSSMLKYHKEYQLKITFGDQDLINIYFHDHPEELYQYPCEWNYRPDHCMYMSVCKTAEQHGAFVLHGSRRAMHNDKQPAFRAVYRAFHTYIFGEDLEFVLLERMKRNLRETRLTACGKVSHIFIKQLQEHILQTLGDREGRLHQPANPDIPPHV